MVSTLTWVLAGIVAYTVLGMALRAGGLLPSSIRLSGPITTVHTGRGRVLLNRLAAPKRFWRAWGNLGVGIALVVMAGSFLLVVFGAYSAAVNPEPSALNEPRNVLAIPGVNEFLPLSVAPEIVTGLVLGLVVHEGGHGLLCRVEDIEIDSLGLAFLTVIPVGAFVEPDEAELREASRGSQLRMFAAGVTNNFALSLLALALLFGPVIGSFAVVDGAPVGGVVPGSAADRAGIDRGTVITAVDGQPVTTAGDLDAALANASERTVTVDRREGDPVAVNRTLVVTSAAAGSPVGINATVTAVNGTTVYTERGFEAAARDNPVGRLELAGGEAVTRPLGAYVLVGEEGPLTAAGAPPGERLVITSLAGQRTATATDLRDALVAQSPGEEVTVVGYVDGERRTYDVRLADAETIGEAVGAASIERGTSGFVVDEFGIKNYPAASFLEILGGSAQEETTVRTLSFAQRVFFVLILPFAGAAAGGIDFGFRGFTGIATNFYEVQGPLGAFGPEPAFVLANLLFWAGWINLVIGQFNCVPTFPLDGGHILRASTESVVSRLPVPSKRRIVTTVSVMVTIVMIGSLFGMVFLPRLLT